MAVGQLEMLRVIFVLILVSFGGTVDSLFSINSKRIANKVSDKFLSISLDPAALLTGINITSSSQKLAKRLSPAYLRLGGPSTVFLQYSQDSSQILPLSQSKDELRNSSSMTVTPFMWAAASKWLENVNLTPVFVINDVEVQNGLWNPKSFYPLFNFSNQHNIKSLFQLGYDCSNKSVSQYSRDLSVLRHILNTFPRQQDSWKIIGSDVSKLPIDNLEARRIYLKEIENVADVVMWEPTNWKQFPVQDVSHKKTNSLPKLSIWTTIPKDTNPIAFASALEWTKNVGEAASLGYEVVYREPRLHELFADTPVFWATVFHKQFLGQNVLEVKESGDKSQVHVYSHCTKQQNNFSKRGAIALLIVNDQTINQTIKFKLPKSHMNRMEIQSYILTSDSELSTNTFCNGKKLLFEDLDKKSICQPKIRRVFTAKFATLEVPPLSIGYYIFPGARLPLCAENEHDIKQLLEEINQDQTVGSEEIVGNPLSKQPTNLKDIFTRMAKELEQDKSFYKEKMEEFNRNLKWKPMIFSRMAENKPIFPTISMPAPSFPFLHERKFPMIIDSRPLQVNTNNPLQINNNKPFLLTKMVGIQNPMENQADLRNRFLERMKSFERRKKKIDFTDRILPANIVGAPLKNRLKLTKLPLVVKSTEPNNLDNSKNVDLSYQTEQHNSIPNIQEVTTNNYDITTINSKDSSIDIEEKISYTSKNNHLTDNNSFDLDIKRNPSNNITANINTKTFVDSITTDIPLTTTENDASSIEDYTENNTSDENKANKFFSAYSNNLKINAADLLKLSSSEIQNVYHLAKGSLNEETEQENNNLRRKRSATDDSKQGLEDTGKKLKDGAEFTGRKIKEGAEFSASKAKDAYAFTKRKLSAFGKAIKSKFDKRKKRAINMKLLKEYLGESSTTRASKRQSYLDNSEEEAELNVVNIKPTKDPKKFYEGISEYLKNLPTLAPFKPIATLPTIASLTTPKPKKTLWPLKNTLNQKKIIVAPAYTMDEKNDGWYDEMDSHMSPYEEFQDNASNNEEDVKTHMNSWKKEMKEKDKEVTKKEDSLWEKTKASYKSKQKSFKPDFGFSFDETYDISGADTFRRRRNLPTYSQTIRETIDDKLNDIKAYFEEQKVKQNDLLRDISSKYRNSNDFFDTVQDKLKDYYRNIQQTYDNYANKVKGYYGDIRQTYDNLADNVIEWKNGINWDNLIPRGKRSLCDYQVEEYYIKKSDVPNKHRTKRNAVDDEDTIGNNLRDNKIMDEIKSNRLDNSEEINSIHKEISPEIFKSIHRMRPTKLNTEIDLKHKKYFEVLKEKTAKPIIEKSKMNEIYGNKPNTSPSILEYTTKNRELATTTEKADAEYKSTKLPLVSSSFINDPVPAEANGHSGQNEIQTEEILESSTTPYTSTFSTNQEVYTNQDNIVEKTFVQKCISYIKGLAKKIKNTISYYTSYIG